VSVVTQIAGRLVGAPEQRQTKDSKVIVKATVKARLGRDQNEIWTVLAYDRAAQAELMRLGAGEFVALQGVHQIRAATIHGEIVVQRTIFPEVVIGFRPNGGLDDQLA
jgi:hypothetical protein